VAEVATRKEIAERALRVKDEPLTGTAFAHGGVGHRRGRETRSEKHFGNDLGQLGCGLGA
jgi:hypothetical protein